MAAPIEDYALLSDLRTGPLVSRQGSVDWLCFPRFDSPSVFAALLGSEEHGRWLLTPSPAEAVVIDRHYEDSTFVLQTTWQTKTGQVLVTDFMPVGDTRSRLVRRVTGLNGTVTMRQEITIRPQYATVLPWVSRIRYGVAGPRAEILLAMSGPDALALRGEFLPMAEGHRHAGEFMVVAGQNVDFELTWFPSHQDVPPAINVDVALELTVDYWTTWAGNCRDDGIYGGAVKRSLLVLRALTCCVRSPTMRQAALSPRLPLRCLRILVDRAIGTTATVGCEMRL
jgi:GH15 family glucan-1,4-alpha-glucosidase